MAYDPQCELLAEYFLRHMDLGADYHEALHALAQHIQDTVDTWLRGIEGVGLEKQP
jgi:hypothetical protein